VLFRSATGSAIAATNSQQAFDYSRLRIKHYTDSNLGLSIGYAGVNHTYIQACYDEGTSAPLLINPYGSNTGVGTTSPRARLDVGGAIMTLYQASTLENKAAGLLVQNPASSIASAFGFIIQDGFAFQGSYDNNNSKLGVRSPTADGSLGTQVAYISGSGNSYFAGRMERPGQPAFQVHKTGANQDISNSSDTKIDFTVTRFDIASNMSNNGRFTAPVTGRYMFASTVRFDGASNADSYLRLTFAINGALGTPNYTYGHAIAGAGSYSTSYHSMSIAAVLSLNAGDYVEVLGGLQSGTVGAQFESQFSGFLI